MSIGSLMIWDGRLVETSELSIPNSVNMHSSIAAAVVAVERSSG